MAVSNRWLKILAALVLGAGVTSAMAQTGLEPNGSYSSIGLSLSRTNYASPKCPFFECHEGYGGIGINLSYQVIPNMIIGLRTTGGQSSGNLTTIKESQGGVYIGFVMGVNAFDFGGLLSPVTKRLETCLGSLCGTTEEAGSNVELFGKWWVDDARTFNIGLTLDSYHYANGNTNPNGATKYSSTALSFAYLIAGHHELSISGSRLRDTAAGTEVSTTSNLAYAYRF